tara:strand:- start:16374 stop:16958 length:585 start_codon:yes stop_codon:yes gene_type:complete
MECSKQVIVALLVIALVYMFLTCNNINVLEKFSPIESTPQVAAPSKSKAQPVVRNRQTPQRAQAVNKTQKSNLDIKPYSGDSNHLNLTNPNESKIELGVCGGDNGAFLSSNLLPAGSNITDKDENFSEFSPANLKGKNFIDSAKFLLGTQSQTLRNASHDIRSEPPNPQKEVCAWNNTTISPDMHRRLLEIGTG